MPIPRSEWNGRRPGPAFVVGPDHAGISASSGRPFGPDGTAKSSRSVILHVYTRGSGHCCLQRPPPPSSRPARSTPRPRFVSSSGTMQRAEFPVVPRSHFSAFSFSFFPSFSFLLSALLPPPARPHVRYYLSRATSPTAVRLRPPLRAFRARFRNVCPRARARHGNSRNAYGLFLVAAPCILINFFLSPFFPSSLERSAKYNAIENCTRQILFLFL